MEHILQRARVLLPRRGWRIGLIKEFYPRGPSLLGLNVSAGREVCIRFRVPGKKSEFLPFHEVLCTALHEFTHCAHSQHNRSFWNLYYDLVKECEALEVTMIQQGKQLYPDISYTPMGSSSTASQKSRAGRRDRTVALPGSSPGGRHCLGARDAGGGGKARGGGMHTCSRTAAQAITTAGRTTSSSSPSAKRSTAFPGKGRRLGGSGVHQHGTLVGFAPTRDALRRILADAAERRRVQQPPSAVTAKLDTGSLVLSTDNRTFSQDGGQSDVDDDNAPDCVPQSFSDELNGDSWRCSRCGFLNDGDVAGSCAFCADCNDGDDAEAPSLKQPPLDSDHPPLEISRVVVSSVTASNTVPEQPPPPQQGEGTSKEKCILVSDNDDN
ncbi:WLM domain containing protein, putative [Leishmania guyanensis]